MLLCLVHVTPKKCAAPQEQHVRGGEENGSAFIQMRSLYPHQENLILKPTETDFRPHSNTACGAGAKGLFFFF